MRSFFVSLTGPEELLVDTEIDNEPIANAVPYYIPSEENQTSKKEYTVI